MIVTTCSNLRRANSLLILLSLLILHVGTCQAQDNFNNNGPGAEFFALPLGLFFGISTIMCCCFWTIVCTCIYLQHRTQRFNNPQRPQYGTVTRPYPTQGYVIPSTTPGHPPPTQAYPGQAYVQPSTITAPNAPPAPPGTTLQTVPQFSEPVSLPEATLHQGDAPPTYNEAVTMKTVHQEAEQ